VAKYEVEVEVDAQSAIATLERLRASTERVGTAASQQMAPALRTAADAQAKAEAAAKNNAEQLNKNLAAAAALGSAFGSMTAQLGPVGQALGSAASSAAAMYAAMGPIGAVVGAVAGVMPALINALSDTSEEADRTAQAIAATSRSLDDFIADVRRATAEAGRARRIAAGFASEEEIGGQIRQQEERAGTLLANLTRLRSGLSDAQQISVLRTLNDAERYGRTAETVQSTLRTTLMGEDASRISQIAATIKALSDARRESNRLREQQAEVQRENIAADIEEAEVEMELARRQAEPTSRRGGGARDAEREAIEAAARAKAEQIAIEQKQLEIANELLDKEEQRLRIAKEIAQAELDAADAKAAAARASAAAEKRENERLRILAEETGKAKQLATEEREEQEERTRIEEDRIRITSRANAGLEGVLDIAKRTAEIQRESNASVGDAFKTAVDEWLKGFALQSAYKGVAATAEAIGSAVTNQPNAAAKFAEAGIHFALAAAAGGASAAIPNAGGGGGGDGGGGGRQGPEAVGGGGGGGGGGTVVVNFNSPVAEAEIGRQQERASRAARRRFGS